VTDRKRPASGGWWRWEELTAGQTLICLAIGGVFAAGAVYFAGAGLRQSLFLQAIAAWEQVAARIEVAEFEGVRGSRRMEIRARYSYEYGVRRYVASRVSPDAFPPRDEAAQRRRLDLLAEHAGTDVPFKAWVNPRDPGQSVLFKESLSSPWPNIAGGGVIGLFALLPLLAGVRGAVRLARR